MDDALRDRLAEIEAEHASLKAELRAFQADYMRHVGVIMAQVHDLEARILAVAAERSGEPADREAARAAGERAERTYAEMRAVPVARRAAADRRRQAALPRGGEAHASRPHP